MTVDRLFSAVSMVISCSRWRASSAMPGGSVARTLLIVAVFASSVPDSVASASSALVIESLCASSCPVTTCRFSRKARMLPSLPLANLFSSTVMSLSWAMPPPLSSKDRAPSTCSASTPTDVLVIFAPLASCPVPPLAGATRATYFSPSRLVCRMLAVALAGSLTSPFTSHTTSAYRPLSSTVILVTRPTATLFTLTLDCGTRSSTSVNTAVTLYGWLPRLAPPGSGTL